MSYESEAFRWDHAEDYLDEEDWDDDEDNEGEAEDEDDDSDGV